MDRVYEMAPDQSASSLKIEERSDDVTTGHFFELFDHHINYKLIQIFYLNELFRAKGDSK